MVNLVVVGQTYRFARNGTFRSVNVLAHRMRVRQNDRKTITTSAKNEI